MKKIDFKNIEIKNFLSVGEESIKIEFREGLNIITGLNKDKEERRNGVGKSTIIDAMYYCIFGETIRELKKSHIINNITNGKGEVKLNFTVNDTYYGSNEFSIVRCLNPSKCYVFKNGVDKTLDSIANTNIYIQTVLSATPDLFKNCVFMTLNNHTPFMTRTKIEKRKFIEEIFNLEVFTKMLGQVRTEYNETKKTFDIEVSKYDETSNFLAMQKKIKSELTSENEKKEKDLKDKITVCREEIKKHNNELKKLEKINLQDYLDKHNDALQRSADSKQELDKIFEELTLLKGKIDYLKNSVKELVADKDICPACLRPLGKEEKTIINQKKEDNENEQKQLLAKIKEHKSNYDKVKKEQAKYFNTAQAIYKKYCELSLKKDSMPNIEKNIEKLTDNIKNYENEMENINSDSIDKSIESLNEKAIILTENIDKYKKSINMLDTVKYILSEEGVKSFIVRKILNEFNSRLAYYLKKLDSNCIIIFNEFFEEEIVNEKGKSCSYNNFSGAEKKSIDLACLFAFVDIRTMQGDVSYNISFYDELLDTSFDEKGVQLVMSILNDRYNKNNESIYVITHRKEGTVNCNGEIIMLEKHNGITRRV